MESLRKSIKKQNKKLRRKKINIEHTFKKVIKCTCSERDHENLFVGRNALEISEKEVRSLPVKDAPHFKLKKFLFY